MGKYNLHSIKKMAASRPQVGIFWFITPDNIISFGREVYSGEKNADAPYDHITVWNRVMTAYPKLRSKDYDNVPRGRVTLIDGVFIILVGKDYQNQSVINKIIKEFHVPRNNFKVIVDEHYETMPYDPFLGSILNYDKEEDDMDERLTA